MLFNYIVPTNKILFVWDALFAWSHYIRKNFQKTTSRWTYLTNMLKLIENGVVDVQLPLECATADWLQEALTKIESIPGWSPKTKTLRKSCLNTFYTYINSYFDYHTEPYQRHPKPNEIKYIFSNVLDQQLTVYISPSTLCESLSKINERDAYIIWILMYTGQRLEDILDRKKEDLRGIYLDFEENGIKYSAPLLEHIAEALMELCKHSKVYLFETANGKRILRTQVMRTLKQAGRNIGLDFDLTPKALHRYVNAHMTLDKRSELERTLVPLLC